MNATKDPDVALYLERVRRALTDLPAGQREELLDELGDHLAEVAAEGGGLASRLGPPEEYAAELRAAAGIRGPRVRASVQRVSAAVAGLRDRLRSADTRIGPVLGYARASDFLRLLVPAWWVLRGYVAAMAVVYVIGDSDRIGLLPRLGGSTLAALVILTGFVLLSIWLGRRTDRLPRWPRRAVFAGSALLGLLAVVGFVNTDGRVDSDGVVYNPVYSDPTRDIQDVYVYDERGRPLTNVRLFDQRGRPIDLGWPACDPNQPSDQWHGVVLYPRCPDLDPFRPPDPVPIPAPTPGALAPGVSTPGMSTPGTPTSGVPASGTPTPGALASGGPTPGTSTSGVPTPGPSPT